MNIKKKHSQNKIFYKKYFHIAKQIKNDYIFVRFLLKGAEFFKKRKNV